LQFGDVDEACKAGQKRSRFCKTVTVTDVGQSVVDPFGGQHWQKRIVDQFGNRADRHGRFSRPAWWVSLIVLTALTDLHPWVVALTDLRGGQTDGLTWWISSTCVDQFGTIVDLA
jgi:hypothetical protein